MITNHIVRVGRDQLTIFEVLGLNLLKSIAFLAAITPLLKFSEDLKNKM